MMASAALRLLEADFQRAEFKIGTAKGQWGFAREISDADFPFVYIWIQATPYNCDSPQRLLIRWDIAEYNGVPPTGAFWDDEKKNFLLPEKWPKGRHGSPVAAVFKVEGWAAPGKGFYHPYDRQARLNHNDWPTQNPQHIWTEDSTLTDFLIVLHHLLNCEDYLGC